MTEKPFIVVLGMVVALVIVHPGTVRGGDDAAIERVDVAVAAALLEAQDAERRHEQNRPAHAPSPAF